jgi:hypothetical protein
VGHTDRPLQLKNLKGPVGQNHVLGRARTLTIVLPIFLSVAFLMLGFGLGTSCTTSDGRSLSAPPCDRIGRSIIIHFGLQVLVLVVSAVAIRRDWVEMRLRLIVVSSIFGFLLCLWWAQLY